MKKITSMLMALVLALTLLPTAVWATETEEKTGESGSAQLAALASEGADFGCKQNVTEKGTAVYINGDDATVTKWADPWLYQDTTIENVTFEKGVTFHTAADGITLTLINCIFKACDQSELVNSGFQSLTNSGGGMCLDIETCKKQNITINVKGCTSIGDGSTTTPVYGNKYDENGTVVDAYKKRGHGIALNAIEGSCGNSPVLNISECTIYNVRGNAIQLYGSTGTITISDTKINSWGINSGGYTVKDKTKNADSYAIRGDYTAGGSRSITLSDVYFGMDEDNTTQNHYIGHINVGAYEYNTTKSSNDETPKGNTKGTYTVIDNVYTNVTECTVTINTMNGEAATTQTVKHGKTLTPETPSRDGYTFTGWFTNSTCKEETKWSDENTVVANITLYAGWEKKTTDSSKTTTVVDGNTKTETTTETAKDGTTTKTETVIDTTTGKISSTTVTETEKNGTATSEVVTKTTVADDGTVTVNEVKTATDSTNNVTTKTVVKNDTAEVTATVSSGAVTANAKTVNLDATTAGDTVVETTKVTLAAADATKMNTAATNGTVETVAIKTDVGTLTIDSTALKTITDKVSADHSLELVVKKTDEGTTSTQTTTTTTATYVLTALVDNKPVFEETNKDSNGTITITVPWTSAPGFRQQIVCYYVDGNTRTRMGGAGYKNNTFSWDTNHFSKFEVVSETVSNSRASINISGSSTGTTATTTTTTGKASSATTFDAGVGIYAATAILSVTGMAWIGKKKH